MEMYKLLRKLTEVPGPSGNEDAIASLIVETWKPYAAEIHRDRLGNVIALVPGTAEEPRSRLLLAAHMDEIGLMVKEVVNHLGNGFLRVINLGGVDIRQLYTQRVVVHGQRDLVGVLAALPAHMLPEARRTQAFGFEDLVVDPGLPADELQELVNVGDFISFQQPLHKLLGRNVSGKALDNRASIAAVTVCLNYLEGRQHEWDVLAVATVQEETRKLGAFTSAFVHVPDAAIAIDVTFARGAGLVDQSMPDLNSGPVIDIGPNVHPSMFKALQQAADALEMSVSTSIHSGSSGTDAFGIQIARAGVPTGLISIPLRYMHTLVETINSKDVERAGRLLAEFVARLDGDFLGDLVREMMEED